MFLGLQELLNCQSAIIMRMCFDVSESDSEGFPKNPFPKSYRWQRTALGDNIVQEDVVASLTLQSK